VHVVGFIIKKFVTMYGHTNVKEVMTLLWYWYFTVLLGSHREKPWKDFKTVKFTSCQMLLYAWSNILLYFNTGNQL